MAQLVRGIRPSDHGRSGPIPGRSPMQRHRILSALLAAVFLAAPEARASHYYVDSGGGGDYGSIQPAINAVQSSPRDSILVGPGTYADTLTFNSSSTNLVIVSTGGASVTS